MDDSSSQQTLNRVPAFVHFAVSFFSILPFFVEIFQLFSQFILGM